MIMIMLKGQSARRKGTIDSMFGKATEDGSMGMGMGLEIRDYKGPSPRITYTWNTKG
jgi:hypothetical protein